MEKEKEPEGCCSHPEQHALSDAREKHSRTLRTLQSAQRGVPAVSPKTETLTLHNGIFTVDKTNHQLLGSGSYGSVYVGKHHLLSRDEFVAVKLHDDAFLLQREVKIYNYLWKYKKQGLVPDLHIPRLIWSGQCDAHVHESIVMERLGISLDQLFDNSNKAWTPETVCWVALHALRLLREVHALGIVHRDIKPDNFALGYAGADRLQLYIFDFGLSSQYIDKDGRHNPLKTGLSLIGTIRYASVHNHRGVRQSRRDDLEALCYVLLYFYDGTLKWKQSPTNPGDRAERNKRALEHKEQLGVEDFPDVLRGYYTYVKQLQYDDTPDYAKWEHWFEVASKNTSQLPDWSYYYANAHTQQLFSNGTHTIKQRDSD